MDWWEIPRLCYIYTVMHLIALGQLYFEVNMVALTSQPMFPVGLTNQSGRVLV